MIDFYRFMLWFIPFRWMLATDVSFALDEYTFFLMSIIAFHPSSWIPGYFILICASPYVQMLFKERLYNMNWHFSWLRQVLLSCVLAMNKCGGSEDHRDRGRRSRFHISKITFWERCRIPGLLHLISCNVINARMYSHKWQKHPMNCLFPSANTHAGPPSPSSSHGPHCLLNLQYGA